MDPRLAQRLADDANTFLDDAGLVAALAVAYGAEGTAVPPDLVALLTLPDARLLQWLVLEFDDRGLFDPGRAFRPGLDREARRSVNALALAPLFGPGARVPGRLPAVTGLADALTATDLPDTPTATGRSRFEGLAASLADEERQRSLERKLAALEHPVRQHLLQPAVVVRELGVRPGMEIVDIGAGGGHLSLPLATALAGTGHVWATDVDERMVELLQQRGRDQGLAALKPVSVQPGSDVFYRAHTFDLAVLCSVYEYLGAPDSFFHMLAPTLRSGTGRLAILQGHTAERWFPADFDAPFRHAVLKATAPHGPVWRRLQPSVHAALLALASTETVNASVQDALADDFTRMLDDAQLLADLGAFADPAGKRPDAWLAALGPDDWRLVQWIRGTFGEALIHAGTAPAGTLERRALRSVNWLALLPFFHESLPREVYPRGIYLTPAGIARRMARVGYRLERTVTALPAHDFLVFAPATPGR
ncbi:MAG: methyltransferase domain-containing protein [Myxococcales bacterium]|nr:methyltransferase domain-containing protein [Myxococcales bacterium]